MKPTVPQTVTDRFLSRVAAAPDNVAVIDGSRSLSYADLHAAATIAAQRLARQGIAPGSLVGLSVTRGWRAVVGILAIWLSNAGYVPIDPRYPAQRRSFIASDARIAHVLTDGTGRELDVVPTGNDQVPHQVPADTAYVIYTSGSTGMPKGVVVRHANVASLLRATAAELPVGPDDVGTLFHSYNFDFSVWEMWRVLVAGGRCIAVPPEATVDPDGFADLLADNGVTLLNLVPSVFGQLVRALRERPVRLPRLREVIFGGEPIDLGAVQTWYRLGLAPQVRLVNMYGITETTVHVTVKRLDEKLVERCARSGSPIGRPLPHLRVLLLDEQQRPVVRGSIGEMYVAGDGVSAGYLGRQSLTGERFVPLPHDGGADLWYRTGDYAVERDDGELFFTGRRDGQVQLRGYRIELGEVEAALGRLPEIAGSGVLVALNRLGDPVLMACYIRAGGADVAESRLRAALREQLPAYMLPARLISVPQLPITPEGKLDRTALARCVAAEEHASALAPRGPGN
jgi:D-alanine--poly(phosphoribitol) ligase subunit 1